jgi:hypothetical protein
VPHKSTTGLAPSISCFGLEQSLVEATAVDDGGGGGGLSKRLAPSIGFREGTGLQELCRLNYCSYPGKREGPNHVFRLRKYPCMRKFTRSREEGS